MKKFIIIIILSISISGCSDLSDFKNRSTPNTSNIFWKAVWLSMYDLNFSSLNIEAAKNMITTMFENCKNMSFNAVICQVRPNADAYYPSKYFPFSSKVSKVEGKNPGYDPMQFMIETAHNLGLEFHAWINPYRVAASIDNINSLSENNPARVWLNDKSPENDRNVIITPLEDGKVSIYFNPAKKEVQKLIVDGVREILENYDVDGIHFDDYFYPTTEYSFDDIEYNEYSSNLELPLSREDWRRANVNSLIQAVYRTVNSNDKVVFGISPSAHISKDGSDKNFTEQYADICKWISNKGYVDYIAPQLYFGYEYPNTKYQFNNLLNVWLSLERLNKVKIYIGIPSYKIGKPDAGNNEWFVYDDILARQYKDCLKQTDGIIVYSYSSLFSKEELNEKQKNNLYSAMIK